MANLTKLEINLGALTRMLSHLITQLPSAPLEATAELISVPTREWSLIEFEKNAATLTNLNNPIRIAAIPIRGTKATEGGPSLKLLVTTDVAGEQVQLSTFSWNSAAEAFLLPSPLPETIKVTAMGSLAQYKVFYL
jgi:hypothetical protein